MSERLNVVVILAKCRASKQTFGIRVEEKYSKQWFADWAFEIKESKARKEGYGQSEIRGAFRTDPAYPGCPHCHASSFFKCGCGKLSCWDGETRVVTCSWCGSTGTLSGEMDSIRTDADR